MSAANPWYCYCLASEDGQRTYIGATVDPDRRLRQHNGHLVGGARATHGRTWRRVALVRGFPDNIAALQFEWAWKHRSRRHGHGIQARMLGLRDLLASPQSTSKAVPFAAWPDGFKLAVESEDQTLHGLCVRQSEPAPQNDLL